LLIKRKEVLAVMAERDLELEDICPRLKKSSSKNKIFSRIFHRINIA